MIILVLHLLLELLKLVPLVKETVEVEIGSIYPIHASQIS